MASTLEIRKYPNRRYYNTRDSRHVTLEEIRDLVREGHNIKVVDSRTEEDISVAVLTQILLEIESPKLAFFPADFLQHLIRVNTDIFKSMTENYFKSTLAAFMNPGQTSANEGAGPFGMPLPETIEEWQHLWLGMMAPKPEAPDPAETAGAKKPEAGSQSADRVAELSKQLEAMRRALEELRKQPEK